MSLTYPIYSYAQKTFNFSGGAYSPSVRLITILLVLQSLLSSSTAPRDPLTAPSSAVNSALFAQDRPILDAPRLRFYGLWHSKSANFNVYKHLFNLSREDVQLSKVIVLKKPERGTFQAILKGYYYCC